METLKEKLKNLTPTQQKILKITAIALIIYILDAWLLGSISLMFSDWDLMKKSFTNPFYAAIAVPLHGSIPVWIILNIITLASVSAVFYAYYMRYPELHQKLFPRKEPEVSDDPTCGTSRWMTRDEAEKFFSFGHGPGILIGSFEGEPIRHDNPRLNRNCIVFGPPGTGKTWSFILPNLLQAAVSGESVIATDPKGEILRETLTLYQNEGYVIRSFNLVDMNMSDRWNPVDEVRSELDAHLLTQIIIENTEGPAHRPGGDKFWERSEQNLLNALVLYAVHEMKPEERSLAGIYDFLTSGSFDELDGTFRCLPDDHPAKRPYNLFCMAEPKTRGNIIAGLGTRLKVFQSKAVRELTSANDIDLELPGRRKCIYYCVIPDTDRTFEFLSSLFFSFLFLRLTRQADRFGGKNPVRVNFIMDEFCTIGALPNFKDMIATMRGRNINCMMVAQSLPQLKERYPYEAWKEIIGCCALRLVWGAAEKETTEYVSSLLGSATVEQFSFRRKAGVLDTAQVSVSPKERALMDPSEVGRLPFDEGIALVMGGNPLRFKKLSYREHPSACLLTSGGKYTPFRERNIKAEDIHVQVESSPSGWEGFIK
ncbi:MAG: TRAG family protein [Clostridia bacterium 41_269]|nr:MAG: TRAG family protein [Clostridia bacterium 41_269]